MKANSSYRALAANILLAALTIMLTLGLLELFARSFVTVRNVGPAFTVYDPVYGKRLKANLHATRITPEFRFEINTNSLGMRDPEPTAPLTGGIVFVGDSFTMGYGVQDKETFPALIRDRLEMRGVTVPVLNIGMGNNGNGRWVKFFEHDALAFHPRIIVFQVMANDFDDNLAEHLFQLDSNSELHEFPVGPPGLERTVQRIVNDIPGLAYSHLVSLVFGAAEQIERPAMSAQSGFDNEQPQPSDALTFALVRNAVERARAMGADAIGLFVGLTGERRAKMTQIFTERGLPCLDGPSKEDAPDMFYNVDGHWNSAGHRRATELLLPEILRRVDPQGTS